MYLENHKIPEKIAPLAMGQRQEWAKDRDGLVAFVCIFAPALHILEVSQEHHFCINKDAALGTTDCSYQ